METKQKKIITVESYKNIRDEICFAFETLEREYDGFKKNLNAGTFKRKQWNRPGGGGGEMSIMYGRVFEKVGVNFSEVYGELSSNFRTQIDGAKDDPKFWASGVSVVAHPWSPFVPAAHMNIRFITTKKEWFGGGIDLTPTYEIKEDTNLFHSCLKNLCNSHNPNYYKKFSKWCDDYFYIPHRQEPRGAGGIFFDNLCSESWENDFSFIKDIGKTFQTIYPEIIRKHYNKNWTTQQKEHQLLKRGRYVEFNLLYDRGTKFGLQTEGNIDAILMSLPPSVKWP